jgi:DNA repair protein RadD
MCDHCKAVIPHKAKECPACGEPVRATTTIRAAEGDLVELHARSSGKNDTPVWAKKVFYSELKGLKKPGYKDGWVAWQFKNKFGHWPPRDYDNLPEISPSHKTFNWLKSRQIAFAKRRTA